MARSLSQKSLSERRMSLSEHNLNQLKDEKMVSRNSSGETTVSSDIEAPPPIKNAAGNSSPEEENDDDEKDEILVDIFEDTNGIISVPLAGVENDSKTMTRRQVPNGCAICLSSFDPDEKITRSYNPQCSHIFHHECVLHWYLAVGRKEQRKRRHQNSQLRPEEELAMLCKFPMVCPCCRRPFCKPVDDIEEEDVVEGLSSGSSGNVEALTTEPASANPDEQSEETPPIDSSSSPQITPPVDGTIDISPSPQSKRPADATFDTSSSSPQSTRPADAQEEDTEQPSAL